MRNKTSNLGTKFYSFFYCIFWGFYFSARYFAYKKINSSYRMSV